MDQDILPEEVSRTFSLSVSLTCGRVVAYQAFWSVSPDMLHWQIGAVGVVLGGGEAVIGGPASSIVVPHGAPHTSTVRIGGAGAAGRVVVSRAQGPAAGRGERGTEQGAAAEADEATSYSPAATTNPNQGKSMKRLFDARAFFDNELYSDVTLEFSCDGVTARLPAHRMVLHQSSFFEAAMNSGMRDAECLAIPDVNVAVGRAITRFYYGHNLEIAPRNLLETLQVIDRLQLTELVEPSCDHLKACLAPTNALDLAAGIAERCPWMLASWLPLCSAYIASHEEAISATDHFQALPCAHMMALMAVRDPPIFVSPISFVVRWLCARDGAGAAGEQEARGEEENAGNERRRERKRHGPVDEGEAYATEEDSSSSEETDCACESMRRTADRAGAAGKHGAFSGQAVDVEERGAAGSTGEDVGGQGGGPVGSALSTALRQVRSSESFFCFYVFFLFLCAQDRSVQLH